MDQPLIYKSVLPAISIEFQDETFLDVDDIISFTISKTEENIPSGIAIVDVRFGKRMWHSIREIFINGQAGRLISFDRFGHPFDRFGEDDDDVEDAYNYAKLVVKYDMSDLEIADIISRRITEIEFEPGEDLKDESETEDTSTILQCGEDTS